MKTLARSNGLYVHMVACDATEENQVTLPTDWDAGDRIVVCDVTSTIFSRHIDVRKYGIIYFETDDLSIPGATVVVARDGILAPSPITPSALMYNEQSTLTPGLNKIVREVNEHFLDQLFVNMNIKEIQSMVIFHYIFNNRFNMIHSIKSLYTGLTPKNIFRLKKLT